MIILKLARPCKLFLRICRRRVQHFELQTQIRKGLIRGVQGFARSDPIGCIEIGLGKKLVKACENSRVFGWGWVAYNFTLPNWYLSLDRTTNLLSYLTISPSRAIFIISRTEDILPLRYTRTWTSTALTLSPQFSRDPFSSLLSHYPFLKASPYLLHGYHYLTPHRSVTFFFFFQNCNF